MILIQDGNYYITRNGKKVGPVIKRSCSGMIYGFRIGDAPYTWFGEATVGVKSGSDLVTCSTRTNLECSADDDG